MLGRRSSKLRYVPLVGLLGVTLAASLVPGVAGADQSISTDVPEWAQDTGSVVRETRAPKARQPLVTQDEPEPVTCRLHSVPPFPHLPL